MIQHEQWMHNGYDSNLNLLLLVSSPRDYLSLHEFPQSQSFYALTFPLIHSPKQWLTLLLLLLFSIQSVLHY